MVIEELELEILEELSPESELTEALLGGTSTELLSLLEL